MPARVEDGEGVQGECGFCGVDPFADFAASLGGKGEEAMGCVVGFD